MNLIAEISNFEKGTMLALIIASSLFFVYILIAYFLNVKYQKQYDKKIQDKANTIRVFIVDVANEKCSYFNTARLRTRKYSSLTSFYNRVNSKDREKLITWIGELLDMNSSVRNSIEVSIYIKKRKRSYSSIFEVQKIDYEKQLIFLESRILGVDKRKDEDSDTKGFISLELFNKNLRNQSTKGETFCIDFFDKLSKADGINYLYFAQIKTVLEKFSSNLVIMSEINNSKILITNYEIDNKIKAINFIEKLRARINSYLLIESLADEFDFSFGAIENQFFHRDTKALIETAVSLSLYAKDNNKKVIFFDESSENIEADSSFRSDVENVIKKNNLSYQFQSIYDADRTRPIGYLSIIKPIDSMFSSIDELKNYALRTNDDKNLFYTLVSTAFDLFDKKRIFPGLKLFFPVSLAELTYANSILGKIPSVRESRVVLIIEEKDIVNIINKDMAIDNLSVTLKALKSKGFEISLHIDNEILTLSPSTYSLFGYLILPYFDVTHKNQTTLIPAVKSLIEQLIKYNKPLISVEIPTWDVVELLYKFGINILSSDLISPPSVDLLPVDKKIITKIKKLDE